MVGAQKSTTAIQLLTDKAAASQLRTGKVTFYLIVVLFLHPQMIAWYCVSRVVLQFSRDLVNPDASQRSAAETLPVGAEVARRTEENHIGAGTLLSES